MMRPSHRRQCRCAILTATLSSRAASLDLWNKWCATWLKCLIASKGYGAEDGCQWVWASNLESLVHWPSQIQARDGRGGCVRVYGPMDKAPDYESGDSRFDPW